MGNQGQSDKRIFEQSVGRASSAGSPGLRQRAGTSQIEDERTQTNTEQIPARMPGYPNEPRISDQTTIASPQLSRANSFQDGQVVCGRFTIHHFIARGGMGEVYEAWDAELKERVALKCMSAELAMIPNALERFKREVKQARLISHANVCRVHELFCHDSGSNNRLWFLSMEYLEGTTLLDYLRHKGPIARSLIADLVEQMVRGLIAAHQLGVVHRDFKTSNVMVVNAAPGAVRLVITDFGLALNVFNPRGRLQEPGGQGTPAFMAPEQRGTGEVTFQADQYALGVVICEVLTGARPVREPGKDSVKLPAVPLDSSWKRLLLRCLQEKPEQRFANMNEVLQALPTRKKTWRVVVWPVAAILSISFVVGEMVYSHLQPVHATSLAVLPLQNGTGDASLDYLGAGISDALTDDLSKMPGLQVTAESVVRRFRQGTDPRAAGHKLSVGSVVDGSVAELDGTLRVPIELVDVKTGRQIWGKTYETRRTQIAELQHEISTDVAFSLKIKLDPDARARLKRQYSTNPSTYDSYLRGRFHLAQRTPDALHQAVVDFQQALADDPQYAPAHAGLADCYSLIAYFGLEKPLPLFKQALDSSQQALQMDSTLGEAYTSRAFARTFLNFEWQGAEDDYKRAQRLNPSYITAHSWYGEFLLIPLGRFAEAKAQADYLQGADPDSFPTILSLATVNYFMGNYKKTISLIEPQLKDSPQFEPKYQILALAYLGENRNKDVITLLDTGNADPEIRRERAIPLGIAYAREKQESKAAIELKTAEATIRDGFFLSYETALLYTALGNREKALDMLELAYSRRESNLVFLNVDPMLVSLHSEPRFVRLLGMMNLSTN